MLVVDRLICNPNDFEPGGPELDLAGEGIDVLEGQWDESDVDVTTARTETGVVVTDRQAKEREPTLALRVREEGGTDLPTAAHNLQSVVGYWQRRGGWLQRNFVFGGSFAGNLACRVHKASIDGLSNWKLGNNDPVTLKLLTDGVWLATVEVQSEEFTEAELRELRFTLAEILGTAPGHIRIRVKNESESAWRALIYAAESRDYPADPETADTTAALAYAAADLTPKGGAEVVEVEGEKVVEHAALTAGWLTILNSEISAEELGHMTHVGARRLLLRAEDLGEEPGDVELRIRYRSLGTLAWETNRIVPSPVVDDWQLLDMGECRVDSAVLGDQRWEMEVQARAPGGSGKVRIHRVCPLPTEQYIRLTAPAESQGAEEQDHQSPGTVEKVADPPGAGEEENEWSEPENAKTSDDQYASASTTVLGGAITEWLKATSFGFTIPEGANVEVLGAVVGVEGHLSGPGAAKLYSSRVVIGGEIEASFDGDGVFASSDSVLSVGSSSEVPSDISPAQVNASNFGVAVRISMWSDTGEKVTVNVDAITLTIYYTEAANPNRICFANRSIELRTDGVYRQAPEDDIWGKVIPYGTGYPVALPSGLEEKPYRGIVIPSAGDLDAIADSGTNPMSAQAWHRGGYSSAREAAS